MQQSVAKGEIKQRAGRIGLSLPKLARAAGVAPSTAYRIDGGGGGLARTHVKIIRLIEAKEAELFEDLKARSRRHEAPP